MIKKEFKEVFGKDGVSRHYVQHNVYKNLTIPLDVFNDMTDDEVENYITQHLNDVNKQVSSLPKVKKPEIPLSPEEISREFAEIRRKLQENLSFKDFFNSRK
jgi:hypothetical protein